MMSHQSNDSPTIWLSLLTSPFLLSLIAIDSVVEGLIELGQASEEIFRGERLPILNIPEDREEAQ